MRRRLFAAALAVSACASVPRDAGFGSVQAIAKDRLGREVYWRRGSKEDAAVDERTAALLRRDLTEASAVEVALLNNPGLQAVYEDLGVAQADLVQAGLLSNPTIGASLLFPTHAGAGIASSFSLVQEFVELFTLPLRKRIADQQFEQAKLRVSDAVLRLAAETRAAFYTLEGAEQVTEMLQTVADGAKAAAEFAAGQRAAGNITYLDLGLQQDAADAANVAVARAQAEALRQREALARLLGVYGEQARFKTPARLPELATADPPLEHAESMAISRRLDLLGARKEREALAYALSLQRGTALVPSLAAGVEVQRETTAVAEESVTVIGPTLTLQLPIFDQGQARVARLEALLRQAEARADQLAVRIRSEVREARNRLVAARSLATYYQSYIIPRRAGLLQQSMLQYNAMQVGIYQLLIARQNQTTAFREYIETVRDYWVALSDLERSIGGPIGEQAASPPQ